MGLSVQELFTGVIGREPDGFVRWGETVNVAEKGVYVVVSDRPLDYTDLSDGNIQAWLQISTELTVDGKIATFESLKQRVAEYIDPNETILYIGETDGTINNRLWQLFHHILGKTGPHRGGHWIQAIGDKAIIKVYYAAVDEPGQVELDMLDFYGNHIRKTDQIRYYDSNCVIPFANLQLTNGHRKRHGLRRQVE